MRWPGLELDQLEGARADHVGAVARMGLEVLPVAVDVLGQDRAQRRRHRQHDRRMRRAHADDGGVGVGRVHLLHRAHHGGEGVVGLDRHDREGHVGRGHRLAVVEHGVLAQVEGERLAVLGQLPRLGEVGLRIPLVVEAQRAGEDLGRRHGGRDARLHRAVEVPRGLGVAQHQRAAALGGFVGGGGGGRREQRAGGGQGGRQHGGSACEREGGHA